MSPEQTQKKQLLPEQKKIRKRLVVATIFLFIAVFAFFISMIRPAKITHYQCSIIDYYSTLNETDCKIEVECNRDVSGGIAKISFFEDNSTTPCSTQYIQLFGNNDNFLWSYISVPGKVTKYKLESYDMQKKIAIDPLILLLVCLTALLFFICALLLSCNVYIYNDKKIVVYAGWYHHYLLIDGEEYDEHNTLTYFTPITLSATLDDGSEVKATISLTNRIALKINGKLYQREHK